VSPNSIPSRSTSSQHFFSSTARQNTPVQGEHGTSNFSRGPASEQGQHGFTPPASQHAQPVQSSRPGWRTFTPPSGQQTQSNGVRTFEAQGSPQSRSYNPQSSQPPRQYENNSRGGFNSSGSSRPTLNMQQPVVTPRGGGSYSGRPAPSAPSRGGSTGGGSRGGNSGGGSHGSSSGGGHSHH
jgi:hypothetical protein